MVRAQTELQTIHAGIAVEVAFEAIAATSMKMSCCQSGEPLSFQEPVPLSEA